VTDLFVSELLTIPAAELNVAFARSGGPGGQNVQKVETKVELRWNPGESAALGEDDRAWLLRTLADRLTVGGDLVVSSSRTRDQARNRDDAREKLATVLRSALERPRPRRRTRPTRGSKERRLADKRRRADLKKTRKPPSSG
jgi:ribosome-associated protein